MGDNHGVRVHPEEQEEAEGGVEWVRGGGREHGGVVKGPAAMISDTPTLLLFDLHSQ